MTWTDSQLKDLCVITCDAPAAADRASAHRLLRSEMAARLRASDLDWSQPSAGHPAFDAIDAMAGGIVPASFFWSRRDGVFGGAVAGHVPEGDYASAFAVLSAEADALIASVRASMTDNWVDATRFQLWSGAAPGDTFPTKPLFVDTTTPAAIILAAGVYRLQYTGTCRSESTTAGVLVGYEVMLDATLVAAQLVTRPDANIDTLTHFTGATDDITVSGTQTLTLVNATPANQYLAGIVRLWKLS